MASRHKSRQRCFVVFGPSGPLVGPRGPPEAVRDERQVSWKGSKGRGLAFRPNRGTRCQGARKRRRTNLAMNNPTNEALFGERSGNGIEQGGNVSSLR
eukprot:5119894-Pyramimonas_sp.AAC.1